MIYLKVLQPVRRQKILRKTLELMYQRTGQAHQRLRRKIRNQPKATGWLKSSRNRNRRGSSWSIWQNLRRVAKIGTEWQNLSPSIASMSHTENWQPKNENSFQLLLDIWFGNAGIAGAWYQKREQNWKNRWREIKMSFQGLWKEQILAKAIKVHCNRCKKEQSLIYFRESKESASIR